MHRSILLGLGLSSCVFLRPGVAAANETLTGTVIKISYNDYGNWNDAAVGAGFMADANGDGTFDDYSYPGTAYQMYAVGYTTSGAASTWYATSYYYTPTFTILAEADDSTTDTLVSRYELSAGDLGVVKREVWAMDDNVVLVDFMFSNDSPEVISDLHLFFAVDPDQEAGVYGSYATLDDVLDTDSDGLSDWVQSEGYYTGDTIGFGACEPYASDLGHFGGWSIVVDPDQTLTDYDGAWYDDAMGIRWSAPGPLAAGDTREVVFLVVVGDTAALAQDTWAAAASDLCQGCDVDGDGYLVGTCGGDDCDDGNAAVHPGAVDAWYDGIDSDCAGNDDYDADGDGHDSDAYGGDDCDDTDGSVYPGAADTWYDGVDSDCAGNDDFDADHDGYDSAGYGGKDCNESDPTINPGATEIWYDGVDQDCSGGSDYDADGDGHDSDAYGGDDCDDTDADVYLGAPEIWYDGVDQDCRGGDDYDADGDGHDSDAYGGDDCDDTDASVWQDCVGAGDGGSGDGAALDTGGGAKGAGGCSGCATGGSPVGLAGWSLGLVALLGLRRRRHCGNR